MIIYINLFVFFMIRVLFLFMKENLLVSGVGFLIDVIELFNGLVEFKSEGFVSFFFDLFFININYNFLFNIRVG